MTETTKHLWEIDHPYYCEAYEPAYEFESWQEFITECHMDLNLNLPFRFDWREHEGFKGDPSEPNGTLHLFYVQQRIGKIYGQTIPVARNDEPAVIEFLKTRFTALLKVWEPIAP